ncbi:monovalent cation:proton antiporter-2 (CPA2) family protein [Enterococcus sp.]|uniref:cation:proton antiporter n=1 Tax=Enterococcus sp. TaxID=35783 RepID=UPI00289E8F37|nr:monovalent cation:proton antiporter-2 (CPA2) family protein [Enterococcus sp.]
MAFIGILCLILITTTLFAQIAKRLGVPAVIGQLLAGILLGTGGLNWVEPDILVTDFSEIGVILLMFLAGMESDLSLLKRYFKPGMFVAVLGILLPMSVSWLAGLGPTGSHAESFFFGIVLSATSVSISVEVLKELGVVNTKEGSTILGASVVDDILVVLILSLSLSFLGANTDSPSLPLTIVEELLYFGLIFLIVKWLAPLLFSFAEKLSTTASVIIASLVLCFSMAYLADIVGLSSVIGAFFAGIAVGQTKVKREVMVNIEAIGYALFIPVFFVSVGLSVDLSSLITQSGFILLFTAIAVGTKLVGGFAGGKLARFSNQSAWMVGAGMISRGEMALIILKIGQQNQLIAATYYSPLVIVVLFSTLISPLILKYFTRKIYT